MTYFEISFCAYSSLNISTLPNQVILAPLSVWNPVTKPREDPAQRPSPPFSEASTRESALPSGSAAKASAGARKIGTSSGLIPNECGTPENQTGGRFGDRIGLPEGTETGIILGGSWRSGKYEIKGVPGGGRMRENSAAREESGVCFEERAMRRLVLLDSKPKSDWGVISFAKTRQRGQKTYSRQYTRVHLLSEANRITWANDGTSYSIITGVSSMGARNVRSKPLSTDTWIS
jgi:hypothetical protein